MHTCTHAHTSATKPTHTHTHMHTQPQRRNVFWKAFFSFTHSRTHRDTTHQITHTHNWIRAHTYTILAHLHIWLLTFHHDIPPSIRLLRVWLNTYAKSWYTNDTLIVSRIPNVLNTNRYQVSIMSINTDNDIMQIVSFDSKYASNPHHTACLDLLDPMGQPWNHSYDVPGRPPAGTRPLSDTRHTRPDLLTANAQSRVQYYMWHHRDTD